jgi:hypothetical protein
MGFVQHLPDKSKHAFSHRRQHVTEVSLLYQRSAVHGNRTDDLIATTTRPIEPEEQDEAPYIWNLLSKARPLPIGRFPASHIQSGKFEPLPNQPRSAHN